MSYDLGASILDIHSSLPEHIILKVCTIKKCKIYGSHVEPFYQFPSTVASIRLRKSLGFLRSCYPSLHQEVLTTKVISWLLLLVELQSAINCKNRVGLFLVLVLICLFWVRKAKKTEQKSTTKLTPGKSLVILTMYNRAQSELISQ